MDKSELSIEMGCNLFIDTENNHPSVISKVINIQASDIIIKDRPFKNFSGKLIGQKLNEYNLWILKPPKIIVKTNSNVYLELAIENTLDILDTEKKSFIQVLSSFPKNHLLCYSYYPNGYNPYFRLQQELLKRLTEYNLAVEFDFFII